MSTNNTTTGTRGTSKYARKVREHRQMYGNGSRCCGHRHVPGIMARMDAEVIAAQADAQE